MVLVLLFFCVLLNIYPFPKASEKSTLARQPDPLALCGSTDEEPRGVGSGRAPVEAVDPAKSQRNTRDTNYDLLLGLCKHPGETCCKLCNYTWITRVIGLKDNMLDKSDQQEEVYNIVYFRTADCQTTSETKNLSESRSCIMSPLTLLQVSRCEDEQLVPGSKVWEENSVFSELAKAITSLGVSRR